MQTKTSLSYALLVLFAAVAAAVYAQLSAVGDIVRAFIATVASIVVGVLTLYFHPKGIASSTQKKAILFVFAICAITYVASSAYTLVTAKDNGMDGEEFVPYAVVICLNALGLVFIMWSIRVNIYT